jgi:hypothetical protein
MAHLLDYILFDTLVTNISLLQNDITQLCYMLSRQLDAIVTSTCKVNQASSPFHESPFFDGSRVTDLQTGLAQSKHTYPHHLLPIPGASRLSRTTIVIDHICRSGGELGFDGM